MEFRNFEKKLPFKELPPFQRDAVCLITGSQAYDSFMGNAWSAFLLAKQSGFDIKFQSSAYPIEKSNLYIVPGVSGDVGLEKRPYMELLRRVREEGATAYFSVDDGAFSPFEEVFGVETEERVTRTEAAEFQFAGKTFRIPSPFKTKLRAIGAEVLAVEKDGSPVFIRNKYGKGWIYMLTVPMEKHLGETPCVFAPDAPWREIYKLIAEDVKARRHLFTDNPYITLTEHLEGETWWCVAINNDVNEQKPDFKTAPGWKVSEAIEVMKPGTASFMRMEKISK